jgi:hypothetical protein
MGLFHLTVCLLIAPTFSAPTSLLQTSRTATRHVSFAGLRYSPSDPAARTLLTLDTNSDGRIDPSEIAAFAQLQGLDAAVATKEFSSIDVNGDGVLDNSELQHVLGGAGSTETAAAEAAPAKASPAIAATAATAAQPPVQQPLTLPAASEAQPPVPQPVTLSAAPVTDAKDTASIEAPAELISEESRTSLRNAAENVAEELGREEQLEQQARELDQRASEARANSTALIKQTSQDALAAGAQAAHTKTDELMSEISNLEDQAERAQVRASALRAKSKMELEEGTQLRAAAQESLTHKSD